MRIVERTDIDVEKWDRLVLESNTSFFSLSWYLDATAENWSIVIDDDYTCGMALPYSVRMGIQTLYTPIFVRYMEWFGQKTKQMQAAFLIKEKFREIQFSVSEPVLGNGYEERVFQRINEGVEHKLKSQAKRSLKTAIKNDLKIFQSDKHNYISEVIHNELKGKFGGLNQNSMQSLKELFNKASEEGSLLSFEVRREKFEGGIICLENDHQLLYLKGAVSEAVKKQGGMYLALNEAISYAQSKGLDFDFGGSNIDGVRSFNHNLGGQDAVYYTYTMNKGPKWFRIAKRLKKKWIKK